MQATVGMGTLVSITPPCASSEDKSCLRVWLDCPNTNLIPETLVVGRKRCWSECQVEILGWMPISDNGPSPEPPDRSLLARAPPPDIRAFMISYTPRWRRHPLHFPTQAFSSDMCGAPAAPEYNMSHRSMNFGLELGPSNGSKTKDVVFQKGPFYSPLQWAIRQMAERDRGIPEYETVKPDSLHHQCGACAEHVP